MFVWGCLFYDGNSKAFWVWLGFLWGRGSVKKPVWRLIVSYWLLATFVFQLLLYSVSLLLVWVALDNKYPSLGWTWQYRVICKTDIFAWGVIEFAWIPVKLDVSCNFDKVFSFHNVNSVKTVTATVKRKSNSNPSLKLGWSKIISTRRSNSVQESLALLWII